MVVTVYDFYADWCGPCKQMEPIIEELEEERDDVEIKRVDVEEDTQTANEYSVRSLPTFVIELNGEVKHRVIGVVEKTELVNQIEKVKE